MHRMNGGEDMTFEPLNELGYYNINLLITFQKIKISENNIC